MSRFLTFGIGGFHRALTARPQAMDMLEGNATNESTVPTAPVAPPPPPKQPASGVNVWRLLSVGLIAFLLATFTGRLQLPSVVSGVRDAVARAPSGVASSASANDPAAVAAVKDVIQQANDAQAKAFAQHDVSLMRATATDSYYQELLQIDSDLATSGVIPFPMKDLDVSLQDLEITGTSLYGYPPLQEALAQKCGVEPECIAAGAGGLAIGVHTTQFAIRQPRIGLFEPVLKIAALGVVGFALWKVATLLVFPVVGALLGLLIKGALIVAIVLFAMWFFKKRRDEEKPAES